MDPDQQLRCFNTSDLSSSDDRAAEPGRLTSGRSYSMMNIGGNARVHNGDHYTFNQYLPDGGPAAKRQKSEHARQQTATLRKEFLDSVRFPEMFMRQESLRASTFGTYEWVFTGESPSTEGGDRVIAEDLELRVRILAWLRTTESFFWIKGKPGSGKSMLMSFLLQDPRTKKELHQWVGHRTLHVLSFFFWKAGSDLQKTILGLLRSLAWQLARFKPTAVDKLLRNDPSLLFLPWNDARLIDTVEQLLQAYQEDSIFFLIDGLDECEDDLGQAVDLIRKLASGDQFKTCVSSRPEITLTMQLGTLPSVSLQNLNFNDILTYARAALKPYGNKPDTLAEHVARRAEGVFLWAVLVCKSLIRGHTDRDDERTLYERLTAFPKGLEGLFARMFSDIDKVHFQSLKLYFHSLGCFEEETTIALLAATLHRHRVTSIKQFVEICKDEQVRVVSQSRGLIELVDEPHYLHNYDPGKSWALKAISPGGVSHVPSDLSKSQLRQIYKTLRWVHRSAYEYILGVSRTENNLNIDADYKDQCNRSFWQGALWLVQFLPLVGPDKRRCDGTVKVHNHNAIVTTLSFIKDCEQSQALDREIEDGLSTLHAAICSWVDYMQHGDRFDESQVTRCRDRVFELPTKPLSQPMYWFWETMFTYRPTYLVENSHKLMKDPSTKRIMIGLIAHLLFFWNLEFPEEELNDNDEQRFVAMQLITNEIDVETHDCHLIDIRCCPNVLLEDTALGARLKLYTWHGSASDIPNEASVVMNSVSTLHEFWQMEYERSGMSASPGDIAPGFGQSTTTRDVLARAFDLLDASPVFVSMFTYARTQNQRFQPMDIQLPIRYAFSSLLPGSRCKDVNILDLVAARPVVRLCCTRWQKWLESSEWPTQKNSALQVFDLSATLSERLIKLLSQQVFILNDDTAPGRTIELVPRQEGEFDVNGTAVILLFQGLMTDFHALAGLILDEIWEDSQHQLTAWGHLYCRACVRRWFKLFWVHEGAA